MTDSLTPTPMAKNADSALHVGNDFPPGRPKGNQPPLGAATREAAEREGQEFTAGPPQGEFAPPRGAATRETAEREGQEFTAGPPQGEFAPPRGAATREAAEREGQEFTAGPPQGEFAPPRGAATREAAERGGTAPLIRLRGITKVYGSGSTAFQALKGVDLDIQRGDFVAIMGPSGSGKSTAMNTLGCLDTPTTGIYEYQGVQVQSLSRDQRARLRRRYLGFVFQGFNLLARTSAQENVELPLIYRGEPAARRHAMAARALDAVGLKGWEHHTPGELSGGQQQRVAIARAIVTEPAVLLADEPTGNLDTARSQEIMELLWHLNADLGITVLMVTHEPDMAAYARRMVRFVDGVVASDERNPHPVAMRAAPAEGAV
jgi:putative ABC transport system ATP-binding protein